MTYCEWEQRGESYICKNCLTWRRSPSRRKCGGSTKREPPTESGLGDRIERWLSSHGITEDRYKEIKQKFGLPANCGCGKRKQWFNKVGAYLGISADTYGPNKETK